MRALVAENALHALRNLARTMEVVRALRDAGLETMVLKGPLLAHDLYGDIGLRVTGDIDLLVKEADFLYAAQTLSAAGYQHDVPATPRHVARLRKSRHDMAFTHPDDDTLIELHADVAQPLYGYRLPLDEWWKVRRARDLSDEIVYIPALEHAWLLAILHAAKHRWHRLDLVADLASFARLGIDYGLVRAEAARAWLLWSLLTGEAIAAWLFDKKPYNSAPAGLAVSQIILGEDFGRWNGILFDLRLRERLVDKAGYLWRRLLSAKVGL